MERTGWKDCLLKPEAHPHLWLIILAAVLAVQMSPWWIPSGDAASYLSIARSLGEGRGLTRFGGERHLYYAPGYPLLIAPAFAVRSAWSFPSIRLIHWLLAVLFMLGLYRWSRRYFERNGLFVTMLVILNVSFLYYARRVGPEIGFMAFMIWAANLLTEAAERPFGASLGFAAAGGVLAGFLCWIRPVGVFVAAGFGLTLLALARRGQVSWKRCFILGGVICLIALASVLAFIVRERATASEQGGNSTTYMDQIIAPTTPIGNQLAEGLRLRIAEVGRILIPGMFKCYDGKGRWIPNTLLFDLPAFLIVAVGWRRFVRTAPNALAWTLPLYLGMYVIWPYEQGTRFMMPMLPVLWAAVWQAALRWTRWLRPAAMVLIGAHLLVACAYFVSDCQEARAAQRLWPAIQSIATAVRSDARSGAVCADRDAASMLAVALDRAWPVVETPGEIKPGTHWLLMSDDAVEVPGYETRFRGGGLRLLERVFVEHAG